ncbi:MAG: ATP-binding cassette domain-containing protein [Spirochaetaceae bacterium]|nr:ATP-binding cassette domain-containing protein [Spirochaetaceae bacterium]
MPQIQVDEISKSFYISKRKKGLKGALKGLFNRESMEIKALDKLSFSVEKGEILGYLGPNGAGKSTTLKILSGILSPDSGNCMVQGRIPWKDRINHVKHIGVVFGQRTQLWWDLPVIESFDLLQSIYSIPKDRYQENRDSLTDLLDLEPFLFTPVRQLSLGQRMRCEIAASMLHDPSILFLDEPTIGLDALSKVTLRNIIKKLNREYQVTVILTTHDMDDIEALCSRILVIGKGAILFNGSIEALRKQLDSKRRILIETEENIEQVYHPKATLLSSKGNRFELTFSPREISAAKLVGDLMKTYSLKDIIMENPPIEEIIAQLYLGQKVKP